MHGIWIVVAWLLAASPALAGEWKSKGELSFDSRWFPENEPAALDPTTDDYGIGMVGRAEAFYRHEDWRAKARAFGRVDAIDEQRSVVVVEEAWIDLSRKNIRLRVGADIVNWTATEAFHPADIINARNFDSDFEYLEKLGEPMAVVSANLGGGKLTAYGMPFYTEPILASPRSRLNFAPGLPIRPGRLQMNTRGELTTKDFGGQGALHYIRTFGSADIAIYAVHHLDRLQPLYVTAGTTNPVGALLFQTVSQAGLTYQHAIGMLLAKLEFGYRYFHRPASGVTPFVPLDDRDHAQIAAGLEYTHTHPNSVDSTFMLEGQVYAGQQNQLQRRSLGLFQRDILLGYRVAFNDVKDKAIVALGIFDLENAGELMASIGYSQRLSDVWGLSATARVMHAPDPDPLLPPTGLETLRHADQLRLSITRYF